VRLASRVLLAAALASCLTGCATAPKYVRPEAAVPPEFKEGGPAWKTAAPADQASRGPWWETFGDAQLNDLEARLTKANNTLRAAQASFEQARAAVTTARSYQLPTAIGAAGVSRNSTSENRPNASRTPDYSDYLLRADVAYEADVWGRVRLGVAAARATAQAAAADAEAVSLSLHAELAVDYFALRALESERQILETTVAGYERALALTTSRFTGGIASAVDVAQARTQLESARAQVIDLQARRAQVEHAVAVLTGQPPSAVAVTASPLEASPPVVPGGLPSALLERRPDIAAAERRVAAASAQVGIAASAFYPVIALTGSGGFESASLSTLARAASSLWTVAPAAASVIFDGGRRRAARVQARAAYDRSVAVYRDTVLLGFREVEDNLATLRVLADEAATQAAAVAAAERSLQLSLNRYQGGLTTYLEVVAAQTTALANRRAALNILARRMSASVLLVKALGGGWQVSALPSM
jgi:NodT family efflux transporter outer membrane factor (OMF) lipoprotein